MTVVEQRVTPWVELVGELVGRPVGRFPRQVVAEQLARTFDTQVSWNWLDPGGVPGFDLHTPIPGWPTPDVRSQMTETVAHHPLLRWFSMSGDPAPMSIGRVPQALVTRPGRQMVADHLAPVDMDQQLSIPYRLAPGTHRAFVLARTGEDFADEDLQVAQRVQTLLLLLDRQCTVLARSSDVLAARPLTAREAAVLRLLADGLTAAAIGHRLLISPRTVHRHLEHVYRKLGVNDRLGAVLTAREAGLLRRDEPGGRDQPEEPD